MQPSPSNHKKSSEKEAIQKMPRRRSQQQQQHRGDGGGGYNDSGDVGGGDVDELNIPLDSTSVIRRLVYSDQDSSRLQLRRVDTIAATAGNDVSPSSSIDSDDLMFEEEDMGGGYIDGTKMRMMSSYGGGGGGMDRFSYSGSGYRGRGGRQPYIPQSIEEYRALDSNDEGDSGTGDGEAAASQRSADETGPSFVAVEDDSFCSFLDGWCT